MTGQRSSGAGRGLVSPNCSKRTFALYQLSAAGHSTSALRRGGNDDKSLLHQLLLEPPYPEAAWGSASLHCQSGIMSR